MQSGSVILLDLSNQESMSKNAAIAELLQASGLLGDSPITDKVPKRVTNTDNVEIVSGPDSQIVDAEEKDVKSEEEISTKDDSNGPAAVPTLSLGKFAKVFQQPNGVDG